MSALEWEAGSDSVRAAVDDWWSRGADAGVLRENDRRRIARVSCHGGAALLVKQFRASAGGHRLRETVKGWFGRSPSSRELAHLRALRAKGVAVPEVLGVARSHGGDRFVVLPYLEGSPLREHLATATPALRRATLVALGDQVRRLHDAGFVHGDLHGENIVVSADGPVLLDLQHARRTRAEGARTQDLGDLDYSLWDRASRADRIRIRAAALAADQPFGASTRRRLRAVGAAALRRAAAHGRSRTRHALRTGRQMARLEVGDWRGLRCRDVPSQIFADALAAHRTALDAGSTDVLKDDGRSRITRVSAGGRHYVVKQVAARGAGRVLADALRGSAAWRAFRGGHGLRARGIGAARPEALLERRHLGLAISSIVFLEDLAPASDAAERAGSEPELVASALLALLLRLHRRNVVHGDLKATHVLLSGGDARLIDLEGVRFPDRLGDEERLESLSQLNASLPDALGAELRLHAFRRYAAELPFERGRDAALQELVRRSLARQHRWTGAGCAAAGGAG